jgi:hypothetical protein
LIRRIVVVVVGGGGGGGGRELLSTSMVEVEPMVVGAEL